MPIIHPFMPVWTPESNVLILGTFPSVVSRENEFYYGHPRNRFWQVLARLHHETVPGTIGDKKAFLVRHHIALWDVLASCEITGSSDAAIRNAVPNNIAELVNGCAVKKILLNGKKAHMLFIKYCAADVHLPAVCLPSTSPANAVFGIQQLMSAWGKEFTNI